MCGSGSVTTGCECSSRSQSTFCWLPLMLVTVFTVSMPDKGGTVDLESIGRQWKRSPISYEL